MQKLSPKCMELYNSLRPEQQKRLARWLEIEVGESQKKTIQIFNLMIKGISIDGIRLQILGNEKNKDGLNKELHKLTNYVEEFIVSELIRKKQPFLRQKLLVEYLYDKNLGHLNKLEVNSLLYIAQKNPYRDNDHHAMLRTAYEYLQTQMLIYMPRSGQDFSNEIFEQEQFNIAIQYLHYACTARNNHPDLKGLFSVKVVKQMIGLMDKSSILASHPVYSFYRNFYNVYEDSSKIVEMSQRLTQIKELMPQGTLISLYRILLNQSLRFVREFQHQHAYESGWHLYLLGVQEGWLKIYGEVSAVNYRNMVLIGLKLFSPTELLDILERHNMLTPAIKLYNEDIWVLTDAYQMFESNQYSSLIQRIDNHSFKNHYYHSDAKLLKLKADYMRQQEKTLPNPTYRKENIYESIANICKMTYIQLEKMENTQYSQLIKEYRMLYKITFYSEKSLLVLYQELKKENYHLPNKSWYIKALEAAGIND